MLLQGETKGILRLLRGVLSIHLLAVIAQAVAAICLLQIAITALLRVRSGCPTWMLISAIAILLAEVLETYSGYRGILVVHVPLAMGIFGGVMRQLFWAVRETRSANEALQES